jgi:DNA-binding response OmpR family regulator
LHRVLIVEDEDTVARALERSLKRHGAVVRVLLETTALEATLLEFQPTHVVTDLRMTPRDGIAVLRVAKQLVPDAVRTVLSGSLESLTQQALDTVQPCRLVSKPWLESTLAHDIGLKKGGAS